MSASVRFLFFLFALFTMVCFALGSVMMAQGHGWLATLFFVLAVVLAACGFVAKRRVMPRPQS
ncbi:hypothetical protein [Alicyclobacillus dauci]|uniref:PEP-CTERM protein-sorting domain-containing protein n=1 Tax=Alicyclobacillus dauci TaxID=1475485 RepID=A0ABY6Z132_9BACL|nr:hypothetical protein [Alicyclobacillus dauci]WAH36585.1 hypothetical protein NZD86_20655 [Alicyclobacillus dauci]